MLRGEIRDFEDLDRVDIKSDPVEDPDDGLVLKGGVIRRGIPPSEMDLSDDLPLADGTASAGGSEEASRADHVHPSEGVEEHSHDDYASEIHTHTESDITDLGTYPDATGAPAGRIAETDGADGWVLIETPTGGEGGGEEHDHNDLVPFTGSFSTGDWLKVQSIDSEGRPVVEPAAEPSGGEGGSNGDSPEGGPSGMGGEVIVDDIEAIVTHGLGEAPATYEIDISPRNEYAAVANWWLDDIGVGSFRVNLSAAPPEPALFAWSWTPREESDPPQPMEWWFDAEELGDPYDLHDDNGLLVSDIQSSRTLVRWDTAGTDVADQEVLFSTRHFIGGRRVGVGLRASGSVGNESAYIIQIRGTFSMDLQAQWYQDGSTNSLGGVISNFARKDERVWVRAQVEGTTLRVKGWQEGQEEPTSWSWTTSDTRLSSGGIGVWTFDEGEEFAVLDYLSYGLNGQSAPGPDETPGTDQDIADFSSLAPGDPLDDHPDWTDLWAPHGFKVIDDSWEGLVISEGSAITPTQLERIGFDWQRWTGYAIPSDSELRYEEIGLYMGTGSGRRLLSALELDDLHEDGEILALIRQGTNPPNGFRLFFRARGDSGAEEACFFENNDGDAAARQYVDSDTTLLDSDEGALEPAQQWYWIRYKLEGQSHRIKTWAYGTSEPADWSVQTVSGAVMGAGWIGFGNFQNAQINLRYFAALPGHRTIPVPNVTHLI